MDAPNDRVAELIRELAEEAERSSVKIHVEKSHWPSGRKQFVIDVWPIEKED